MEPKSGIQTVGLRGGNNKTEHMGFQHVALPHLTSPYKGEGKDGHSFPVPLLCKEGQGEVESEI